MSQKQELDYLVFSAFNQVGINLNNFQPIEYFLIDQKILVFLHRAIGKTGNRGDIYVSYLSPKDTDDFDKRVEISRRISNSKHHLLADVTIAVNFVLDFDVRRISGYKIGFGSEEQYFLFECWPTGSVKTFRKDHYQKIRQSSPITPTFPTPVFDFNYLLPMMVTKMEDLNLDKPTSA